MRKNEVCAKDLRGLDTPALNRSSEAAEPDVCETTRPALFAAQAEPALVSSVSRSESETAGGSGEALLSLSESHISDEFDYFAVSRPALSVAILCARSDSVYYNLPGCDVFTASRNAYSFRGGTPVVAHPPCRAWSKLSHFVKDDTTEEMQLGRWCMDQVARCGGVLEHPAHSRIFREPIVSQLGCIFSVPQLWFGHQAIKSTWLWIVGVRPRDLPEIPFRLDSAISRPVEKMSKRQREATPIEFARWLVETARRCRA